MKTILFSALALGTLTSAALAEPVMLGPRKVSEIVARPANLQQTTPACSPLLEIGFFGLIPPPGQVLLMTGFYWSVSSHPGDRIEVNVRVTDGNPSNSRLVAPLSTVIGPGGHFAGIQDFPVPIPLFRGAFKHLCLQRQSGAGVIGTGGFWLFGFLASEE